MAAVAVLTQPGAAGASEIVVRCSNGLKTVVEELAPVFEQQTGHKLNLHFGVAAALKRDIDLGATFDLAILTPALIEDLIKQGKVAAETRRVIARSAIAVAIRSGEAKPDIRTTAALRRTLLEARSIAHAREGASGAFFRRLIDRMGIADALASRILLTTSGPDAAAAVARGDAHLAILPVSEIVPVAGIEVLGNFPDTSAGFVEMVAVVRSEKAQAAAARAFMTFLASPRATSTFARHGMEPR